MALELEKQFTQTYRDNISQPPAIREARCLKVLFPACLPPLEPDDFFAGRTLVMERKGVGFSPDVTLYSLPHGMGYFYREDVFRAALESVPPQSVEANEIREMMDFWAAENTTAKVKAYFTAEILSQLPSDDFAGDVGVGFPLYRMTGAYENYKLLLECGLEGLEEDVRQRMADCPANRKPFYEGLLIVIGIFTDCALTYECQARALAGVSHEHARRLLAMADDLHFISRHAPETLMQALQLHWLYSCVAGVMDYGRMDVLFGGFLAHDLAVGRITEDEALEALKGLWHMMVERSTIYHGRVVIGGMGRPNEMEADRFAMLAMEASAAVHDVEPQLTLRFYEGQNPALMEKALDVIGQGTTYPMLYNDDVNVPAVMNAFVLDRKNACQYVPFGCGEYIIDHRGFGSPNGVINLTKALEVTLFNGEELVKGQHMGLALGTLADYPTFEDLWMAYEKQLSHFIRILADAETIILRRTAEQTPFLMMSLLYDGCIEKGGSMLEPGVIDYLGATLESYGNINAVNSLAAIRWAVYDHGFITPQRLMEALRADFVGYDEEQALLKRAPKYGNDDPYVDDLACRLHTFEAHTIRSQARRVGLHSLLMVVINNSANTYLGRWTGASADGRNARTFLANANNPVSGTDCSGLTAMLNSLARFPSDEHAGVVQNLKFSKDLFNRSRNKVSALLRAYFQSGGTQAMITVTGREELEKALANPEAYRSLLVRVGGFSARFVELEPDVQQEVLTRTCY